MFTDFKSVLLFVSQSRLSLIISHHHHTVNLTVQLSYQSPVDFNPSAAAEVPEDVPTFIYIVLNL